MDEKPLISVVVPAYNAGSYLSGCLESLLGQTYLSFEVILVNDGSTDATAELCDRYSAREPRIRVFHQQNAGVSATRNRAIGYAKGDYLTFVDSDDRVGEVYLENLVNGIVPEGGRGVVVGGLQTVYPDGSRLVTEVPGREYTNREFDCLFTEVNLHHYWYAASKLYDLSLIREKELLFDEQLNYAEDALFLMNYLKWADYVNFIPSHDYEYIQHEGVSLSRSNRSFTVEFTVYGKMKGYLNELKRKYPGLKESVSYMYDEISIYLIRALPAMYRPPLVMGRRERLKIIENLTEEDFKLLGVNYRPLRVVDKLGKVLLLNRWLVCYDWYMSLLFNLRYKVLSKLRK